MRIGIDGRALQEPIRTGVGEATFNLINHLAAIDPNIEFFIFCNSYFNNTQIDFSQPNVHVVNKNIPNKLLNSSLKFLKYPKLDNFVENLDVFFAPNWNFISLSETIPFVLTVHDLSIFINNDYYSPYSRFWHKHLLDIKGLIKRANQIIVPSYSSAEDLKNIFPISQDKINIIGWGADHLKKDQDITKSKDLNLGKYILFLATIEIRKNIEGLIAAFEYAKLKKLIVDDVNLVLAGSYGYGFSKIQKMADNSEYKNNIKILGPVSEEEKINLYQKAGLFIYPSFYEGFGFPPLEAMSFGVPVVASATSSISETLGNAALLIQPYQVSEMGVAMSNLLNDEKLRNIYIQRGTKLVEQLKWQDTAQKYLDVFKKIV